MSSLFALLAQRSWVALSGLLTTVMVMLCLTPQLQGWYYAFMGMVMLYSLFDLGLAQVLVSVSSSLNHSDDEQQSFRGLPANDQFKSLLYQAARKYGWLAATFFLIMIPAGVLFFWSGNKVDPIARDQWLWQWIALVLVTSVVMMLTPFLSMLEGAGNIAEVAVLRLTQGVLGSVACWILLWQGAGLWAVIMVPLVSAIVTGLWLRVRFAVLIGVVRDVTKEVARHATKSSLSWAKEVWPLQWRFGVGWFTSYMLTQIYTPILFYLSGSVVAGQMGISFAIANMVAVLSNSWTSRHVGKMAQAVSEKNWLALNRLFKNDLLWSCVFFITCALVLSLAHHILWPTRFGQRLLPFWPFVGLLAISFVNHLTGTFGAQLRAFQKEPLMRIMLMGATVIVPLAVWAADRYAAPGVIGVILFVQLIYVLPATVWTWATFKDEFCAEQ